MEWKGKNLVTRGDVCDALLALESHSEANAFIAEYRKEKQHADESIRATIECLPPEAQSRLYQWMQIKYSSSRLR